MGLTLSAACCLWSIFMIIFIPDAPHSTRWLTRREAVVVMSRKRHDHHTVEKRQLRWEQVWEWGRDVKTYLYFLLGFFANVPNGATSNCKSDLRLVVSNKLTRPVGTLVIKGFGFDTFHTTLLQIPYGTFIAIMM